MFYKFIKLTKYKFINYIFFWVYLFYPKAKKFHSLILLYYLIPQKIIRINGSVPWPVHFTSRILFKQNITIGNRSAPGINSNCYIQARNGIKIGDNFRIGPGVGLISANHSETDYDQHNDSKPITIGNNVWIGMNSVVLPGISIGDNVMIGANSVVTKDIPSDVVAAGNPCKPLRKKKEYKGFDYKKTNN
jgi:acetyltransferase-like isoleucine patch superfamily enzyme